MKEWSDTGKQLQEAREKRALSLKEVADETRIPLTTLQALEGNDYSKFPSPTYAKSFLNQYAEFLDIDAHEILENFNTANVLAPSDGIEYLNQESPSNTHRVTPIRRGSSPSSRDTPNNLLQPLLVLLITGVFITGGIWGFLTIQKRLDPKQETIERTPFTSAAPVTKSPAGKSHASPTPPEETTTLFTPPPQTMPPLSPTEEESKGSLSVPVPPEETPPPRAIIVNEDEE